MRCGYCGAEFERAEAKSACASCPLHPRAKAGCGNVKCPRCGWESPEEPAFIQKLRAWNRRRREASV